MFLIFVLMCVYVVGAACLITYLDGQAKRDEAKKPWEEE